MFILVDLAVLKGMIIDSSKYRKRKLLSWKRIWEDLEIGYLDRDLLPLLVLMNGDAEIYTTSSCSGRIVVMDAEYPWVRDETGVIFKSHIPIVSSELKFIYRYEPFKKIWIIVNGPIIHFYSLSARKAGKILNTARRVGFKHSGVIHVSRDKGIFVELVTGIYLAQLIKTRECEVVSIDDMESLLTVLNNALLEGKNRLQKLFLELKNNLPEKRDEEIEKDLMKIGAILEKSPLEILEEMMYSGINGGARKSIYTKH